MGLRIRQTPALNRRVAAIAGTLFAVAMLPLCAHLTLRMASALETPGAVVINEIYPSPNSGEREWVELYNPTDEPADLSEWTLGDNDGNNAPLAGTLGGHKFVAVEKYRWFNNSGDTVVLAKGADKTEVSYDGMSNGRSYARISDGDGAFEVRAAADVTKGVSNSAAIPAVPTGLHRVAKDGGEVLPCNPVPVVTPQTVWPTWGANTESDRNHYEYTSYNANGKVGINEKQFTTTQYKHNWVPTEDGKSGFKLRAVDDAGNKSAWSDICYITYDSKPPTVALSSPAGNPVVGGDKLPLAGAAKDENALTYYYKVLDAAKKPVPGYEQVGTKGAVQAGPLGDLAIGGLDSGSYFVRLWAVDAAGNQAGPVDAAFRIDHTPPAVSLRLTSKPTMMASSGPITLAGTAGSDAVSLKLFRDANGTAEFLADLTVDGSGDWAYELPKEDVVQGTYDFAVVAADPYGNETTKTLGSVTVTPFIPAQGSGVPTDLTRPLADAFVVPRHLPAASATTPFTADVPDEDDAAQDVLGTETAKGPAGPIDTAAIATSKEGWKFFGVAWYWWTLFGTAGAGAAWMGIAWAKRRGEQFV